MPSELRRGTTGTHLDTSTLRPRRRCRSVISSQKFLLDCPVRARHPGVSERGGADGGGAPSLAMGYLRAYAASIASLLAGASVVHWALVPDLALPDLGAAEGEGGTPADSGGR